MAAESEFSAGVEVPSAMLSLQPASASQPWLTALTRDERDILTLLARRLSNLQIAETLSLAPPAVEQALAALYRKLAVRDLHARPSCAARTKTSPYT